MWLKCEDCNNDYFRNNKLYPYCDLCIKKRKMTVNRNELFAENKRDFEKRRNKWNEMAKRSHDSIVEKYIKKDKQA